MSLSHNDPLAIEWMAAIMAAADADGVDVWEWIDSEDRRYWCTIADAVIRALEIRKLLL